MKTLLSLLLTASLAASAGAQPRPAVVENVLVVTFDGLRWQELFGGYDATVNSKTDGGVRRRTQHHGLEGTDAQPRARRHVDSLGVGQEPVDQPVAGATHARRSVDEFGDEGPIALVQPARRHCAIDPSPV